MRKWKDELTNKVVSVMRYCYKPLPATTDAEEWEDAKDYIISLVRDQIKKSFMDGYQVGAKVTFDDMSEYMESDPTYQTVGFSLDDCKLGSEKAFNKYEKENE